METGAKVAKILRNLELSDQVSVFEKEGVLDVGSFLFITEEKMTKMGIELGPQLLILNEIKRLKKKVPSRKDTLLTPICNYCTEKSICKSFLQNLTEEKFEDNFELAVPLHENGTANVWIVRWKKEERYAIAKIIKKASVGEKAARAEASYLQQLQGCKYVVELLKVWERPNDLVFLFPVHRADLPFNLSMADLQLYMSSLLKALNEIHAKGIVHGDISICNILFDKSKGKLLLIDFGSAGLSGGEWQKPPPYSLDYVAPERKESNGIYHPLSDIYSAAQLFRHLKRKSNWNDLADDLCNCMGAQKMMCRVTAERALLHPYFESLATPHSRVPSRPTSPLCLNDDDKADKKRKRD